MFDISNIGKYCEIASVTPSGNCTGGYYCEGSATSATPKNETEGGGMCVEGQYCPQGTPEPLTCSPGYFCFGPLLEVPTGPCDAGYYCANGSSSASPDGSDSTG